MNPNQIKSMTALEKASGHKFIIHSPSCRCTLCLSATKVCMNCGGCSSDNFNSLTTICAQEQLTPDILEQVNRGVADHDKNGWFNPTEGPSVLDVAIIPIGTIITSNQNIDFVVFAHYENTRGKRGIRLIETAEYMQANPDVRSYIYAETMAPWFPSFAEALRVFQDKQKES